MAATVGGRLEVVQRPRKLWGPDYWRLVALVLVAGGLHAWLIAHTAITARDSLGFARLALCFQNPSLAPPHPDGRPKNTLDHIRAAEHPPGYPLAVWATDAVLQRFSTQPVPERILLACQLANAIAAVLLVIPTYLLGRMLFSRNVGWAAALLFQVLPVPARITSDGLTEGVYLLMASVAVLLAVRAVTRPRISGFLACGLATGAAYLVRPEGLLVAVAAMIVACICAAKRQWPREAAWGRILALVIGVGLVAVPYMALIGKISNKPTGEYLNPLESPAGPLYRGAPTSQRLTSSLGIVAAWWNHEKDADIPRELWAFQAVAKEMAKGSNYCVWPLALFAIVTLRRSFVTQPGLGVLLWLIACNTALLVYLAARVGYVSERHTLLLTLLGCQLAAAALPLLAQALGQLVPALQRLGVRLMAASLLVAVVGAALPFVLKPMHSHREGHKHAGLWLAERLRETDALVDPFCWAEWYAGRTLYRTSWNPTPSTSTYVIWENKSDSPHSRLPLYEQAKELKDTPGARIVYHWPETIPPEQAAIQVYRLGGE
ncbi:MAG: glycosyltransferase family 39 protein [Gemmataceae bacterium]|nr:glycosyltransferase family 39 protein [Gemmata sp.]MDW8196758.1 glycosyltransferase family 39 protein [Gemmataceae bacterium]